MPTRPNPTPASVNRAPYVRRPMGRASSSRGLIGAIWLGVVLTMLGVQAAGAAASPPTPRYSVEETTSAEAIRLVVLRDATSRVEAAIAPTQGGELASVRTEFHGRWIELLYRGRSYQPTKGFRGKASILWPAVGSSIPTGGDPAQYRSKGAYDYEGQRYPMPQHGFARDKPWRVLRAWTNESEAAVEVVLTDDAESRARYPFGFELHVIYRVTDGRVELRHLVKAAADNTAPMFFSIGNHLGFAVPLVAGSAAEAMAVESPARVEYLRGGDGSPSGATQARSFVPAVPLKDLRVVAAMAVGGYAGDPWFRLIDAAGLAVRVSHHAQSTPAPPVVQFNLWGGTAEGYFCPEPMVGLQNSFNQHAGLVTLTPGKTWTWVIQIELEPAAGPPRRD